MRLADGVERGRRRDRSRTAPCRPGARSPRSAWSCAGRCCARAGARACRAGRAAAAGGGAAGSPRRCCASRPASSWMPPSLRRVTRFVASGRSSPHSQKSTAWWASTSNGMPGETLPGPPRRLGPDLLGVGLAEHLDAAERVRATPRRRNTSRATPGSSGTGSGSAPSTPPSAPGCCAAGSSGRPRRSRWPDRSGGASLADRSSSAAEFTAPQATTTMSALNVTGPGFPSIQVTTSVTDRAGRVGLAAAPRTRRSAARPRRWPRPGRRTPPARRTSPGPGRGTRPPGRSGCRRCPGWRTRPRPGQGRRRSAGGTGAGRASPCRRTAAGCAARARPAGARSPALYGPSVGSSPCRPCTR